MGKYDKGAEWRKWDLHVHTPCSIIQKYGNNDKDTWDKYITDLEQLPSHFAVIGINDYLFLDGYQKLVDEQKNNQRLQNVELLPVVEFRIDKFAGIEFGQLKRINLHVIFSNKLTVETIQSQFLNTLEQSYQLNTGEKWSRSITRDSVEELGRRIKKAIPCDQITRYGSDIEEGFNNLNVNEEQIFTSLKKDCFKGKYLIAIGKTEWSELKWTDASIATKKSIINQADIVFTSAETIDAFYQSKNKLTSQNVNDLLLDCSDAHYLSNSNQKDRIGKCYTWIKADPTFDGLKHALDEADERIFIGEKPAIFEKVATHRTKYIKEISINSIQGYSGSYGQWFDNIKIPLNKELIAIIGNKGSGKSAITDIISLCSNYHNDEDCSFLTTKKFREKSGRLSRNFEATLTWESDKKCERNLNDTPEKTGVVSVKYLPQGVFERLTNEISTIEKFQEEIESVVFSHIPESDRLDAKTFKDLVNQKSYKVNLEIELLKKDVVDLNRQIIELEEKATNSYKLEVENKLRSKQDELIALIPPPIVTNPVEDNDKRQRYDVINQNIVKLKEDIKNCENEIEDKTNNKKRVLKLIQNITDIKYELQQKELQLTNYVFEKSETLTELGINKDNIFSLVINYTEIDLIIAKNENVLKDLQHSLGEIPLDSIKPLPYILGYFQNQLADETAKLDGDQKKYQDYLIAVDKWEKEKSILIGDDTTPDTVKYLQSQINFINNELPERLDKLYSKRKNVVRNIYIKKQEIINVYKDMRNKLNKIIDENADTLKDYKILIDACLEKAYDFNDQFLKYIDKGKVGSFYSKEGSEAQLKLLLSDVDFDEEECVIHFIDNLIESLKVDKRLNQNNAIRDIKDQVKDIHGLYDFIFSLDFLVNKYQLKQGEKNLEQLSPGERGALLLVFYLLLDRNDIPLIIDQPEDNLDNHSVAKILVPFIKEAKKKRQIIMVTHNPNLAVVSDAEQVIYVELDKKNYKFTTIAGSIENRNINKKIVEVLEGAMPAFNTRKNKYYVE